MMANFFAKSEMASSCNNFRSKYTNHQRVKQIKLIFMGQYKTCANFWGKSLFLDDNKRKYDTHPVISYGVVCDAWSGWSISVQNMTKVKLYNVNK